MTIVYTNSGHDLIRDSLKGSIADAITYVALGTGTNAPAVTDTLLQTETFRKAMTSYTNGASHGEVIFTMYLAPGDAVTTIQEVGFFGGAATSTLNSGTLLARASYAHTHVNTESIQFTLDFTV